MNDPKRWLSSSDAPEGMREMLVEAQRQSPSRAQRAALGAKLGGSTSGVWLVPALKFMAVGALVTAGGWSLLQGVRSTAGSRAPTTPSVAPKLRTVAADSLVVRAPLLQDEVTVASGAPREVREIAPKILHAGDPPRKKQPVKKVGAVPSEADLLGLARARLTSDPSAALMLLRRHQKLYPRGILAEERKVLKVRALNLSGQPQKAKTEEQQLRQDHPDSVHHLP